MPVKQPSEGQQPTAAALPGQLAESLFRHEAARLTATLTRLLGVGRLQQAEDIVQEALVRALQSWPYHGVPENPAAWLNRTARNLALDALRRDKLHHGKQSDIVAAVESWSPEPEAPAADLEQIADDRLRLMFACCHPCLSPESQVALALRTLCGFSPAEIASAFLTTESNVSKRLVRARGKLREAGVDLELPAGADLQNRLDAILAACYLLFNEGYKASHGVRPVREELCREAIRLTTALSEHPVGQAPRVQALLALMWLNSARLPARVDPAGQLVRLEEQQRELWDGELILRGVWHLQQASAGEQVSSYHLQAAIAAHHSTAVDYAATDWPAILRCYDRLVALEPSPVAALNRAVALANVEGPEAGLAATDSLVRAGALSDYYLLPAVQADFHMQAGRYAEAAAFLRRAFELTRLDSERAFLEAKLRFCLGQACNADSTTKTNPEVQS